MATIPPPANGDPIRFLTPTWVRDGRALDPSTHVRQFRLDGIDDVFEATSRIPGYEMTIRSTTRHPAYGLHVRWEDWTAAAEMARRIDAR